MNKTKEQFDQVANSSGEYNDKKAKAKAILELATQLEAQSKITSPEEAVSEFKAAWSEVAHHA